MALFAVTAYDKKVWEEELNDFLPEKILDVHAHVWLDRYREQPWLVNGELRRVITKWTAREQLKIHCGKNHFEAPESGIEMQVATDWHEIKARV